MLNGLLDQVKNAIFNDPHNNYTQGNQPGGLIGTIEGLFSNHPAQQGGSMNNPLPASQDPYGDPADQGGYGNVRPASQDPYGDPGAGGSGGMNNPRPASQDPYGDPGA